MPRGVYDRKPAISASVEWTALGGSLGSSSKPTEGNMSEEKLFPVVLNKHYAPQGNYEIIGYTRPKVERKDSAGKMLVVEPEKFIEGEMNPPPYPGTGFPEKIWAGTHIALPVDEAKAAIAKKIADRADVIAA